MLESTVTKNVEAHLEARGCLVRKTHGGTYGKSGFPDVEVWSSLWTGVIEVKVSDNTCSAQQKRWIRALRAHGANAYVLRAGFCQPEGRGKNTIVRLEDENGSHSQPFPLHELYSHLCDPKRGGIIIT